MKKSIALGTVGLFLLGGAAAGCNNDVGTGTEPVVEEAVEPIWVLADRDERRCAWPECGGYFLAGVNMSETLCIGGDTAPECYVSRLDFTDLGLDEDGQMQLEEAASGGQVMLLGRFAVADNGLKTFRVKSALESVMDEPLDIAEDYYRVRFNGTVCVTGPCMSYDATLVNGDTYEQVAGIDLLGIGMGNELLDAATATLAGKGLVVAATMVDSAFEGLTGPTRWAPTLQATAAVLPFTPKAACSDDPSLHYASHDPRECTVILFQCEPSQEYFGGECGCGCVDTPQ